MLPDSYGTMKTIQQIFRTSKNIISAEFRLELSQTIEYHIDTQSNEISELLKDNIYMDNVITRTNNVEEAKQLFTDSKQVFLRSKHEPP